MAMYFNHILGPVVRRARAMRAAGAPASAVFSFLRQVAGKNDAYHLYDYLAEAFLQQKLAFMSVAPPIPFDDKREELVGMLMDERRDEWLVQLVPELPRIRDYFAFLEFAKDENVIVTVCGFAVDSELLLHGVYDADSRQPVWSGKRGELLRSAINRRLGGNSIRRGPQDDWEFRNDSQLAGGLWGPQAPTIEFSPDGDITNYVRWRDMARNGPCSRFWSRLYPQHPVSP